MQTKFASQKPVKGWFAAAGFLRSGGSGKPLEGLDCAAELRLAFGTAMCLDLAAAALSGSALLSEDVGGDLWELVAALLRLVASTVLASFVGPPCRDSSPAFEAGWP